MAEWIDVNERLPEHLHWVLGYDKDLKRCMCGYYDSLNKVWVMEHTTYGKGAEEDITHWMPLPKSPSPQLKCCPSCGFVAVYDEYLQDGIRVRCTYCGNKTDFCNDKIEAAKVWNKRTPQKEGD